MTSEPARHRPTKPSPAPCASGVPTRPAPTPPGVPVPSPEPAGGGGPPDRAAARLAARAPGLALAVAVAAAATVLGRLLPVVGGPVTGIVLGVLLSVLLRPGARLRPGVAFASRGVLQASVVLLGCQLSLVQVVRVGLGSLPSMLGTLAVCLAAAYGLGRALGIAGDLRTLIGVGTGICGASAIAAVTPVIGAAEAEVTYAVSTIFVFNVAAVLVFPVLGRLLGMDAHAFGLFAGTAVNDMSSVVAAASAYGPGALHQAVVVKLTRTLMIIPICLGLAAFGRRGARSAPEAAGTPVRVRAHRLVPWFLVGFLLAAGAETAGLIPAAARAPLGTVSVFLITVALSAIGLSTDPAALRRTGPRPLVLGAALWVTVAGTAVFLRLLATQS